MRPALWTLGFVLFLALAGDFLANGRPLYCRIDGESFFPGIRAIWKDPALPYGHPVLDSIRQTFAWRRFEYESAVFAPVAFSPGEIPVSPEESIRKAPPGTMHPGLSRRFRHWLGTDMDGYDVAAGLIHGARIAVLTGAIAMGIAFFIGLVLGAIAGYWGDDRLFLRRGQFLLLVPGLPIAWFYAGALPAWLTGVGKTGGTGFAVAACFILIVALLLGLGKLLSRAPFFATRVQVPADLFIMRLAEVFTSIPGLLIIIAFAAMLPESTRNLWSMITLIGAFSWPGVARFIRAELLRIRELDYVTAARGLGLSEWRILFRHALPNALRPAYTIFAFGIAGAILLEASLSFLGYGDSSLQGATWGSLLQNARSNPQLWWISLPPGLAIALTILALHSIGEALSEQR